MKADRGSATVLVLSLALVLSLLGGTMVAAAAAMVVRHRAASVADLAALAAADRAFDGALRACAAAERVARANRARLEHCRLDGEQALVTAAVDLHGWLSSWGSVRTTARAGPTDSGTG